MILHIEAVREGERQKGERYQELKHEKLELVYVVEDASSQP